MYALGCRRAGRVSSERPSRLRVLQCMISNGNLHGSRDGSPIFQARVRLHVDAHKLPRCREQHRQRRPAPVKYGVATPQLTGATWALGVGGGTSGGSHRGHTAKSARFRNKRGNIDIKRGHIWRKVLAFGSKRGESTSKKKEIEGNGRKGPNWTFSTQNRR
jgi:hypothetical protein